MQIDAFMLDNPIYLSLVIHHCLKGCVRLPSLLHNYCTNAAKTAKTLTALTLGQTQNTSKELIKKLPCIMEMSHAQYADLKVTCALSHLASAAWLLSTLPFSLLMTRKGCLHKLTPACKNSHPLCTLWPGKWESPMKALPLGSRTETLGMRSLPVALGTKLVFSSWIVFCL